MANHASEESSGFPSERYCKDRNSAYKKLLADLAQHLGPEDVKVIAFNCSLPENLKQSSALDVLDYLDKHARFSPINIQPLAELLTDAYRNDLVHDYVDRYGLKYGTANTYRPILKYLGRLFMVAIPYGSIGEPVACRGTNAQVTVQQPSLSDQPPSWTLSEYGWTA